MKGSLRRRWCRSTLAALLGAAGLAAAGAGQSPRPPSPCPAGRPGDTVDWHRVRPGDTLEGITAAYLGTPVLWRENWELNPELGDPNRLRPGQWICVILHRQPRQRAATVKRVTPVVREKHPDEIDWLRDTAQGNRLYEGDGVRTYREASAELELEDERRVVISEESMVFLERMTTTVTRVPADTIEIREGQADLEARLGRPRSPEIEIIVGGATARPGPDRRGRLENRARRAGEGGAQLMVYAGRTEVRAAGGRVEVPEGMGTRVRAGEPPGAPEKLLPAPRPETPAGGSRWDWANPRFTWRPVAGAASYTVEVCRDPGCGALVARTTDLTGTSWQAGPLPVAELHWRVTAVSASGLDGYPSRPRAFSITSDRLDQAGPTVALRHLGAGRVTGEGRFLLPPEARLALTVEDDASGVAEVRYRWDGGAWETWGGELVALPAEPGPHALEVAATDRSGRSGTRDARVEVDAVPPPPPGVAVSPGRGVTAPEGQALAALGQTPPAVTVGIEGEGRLGADGTVLLGFGGRLRPAAPEGAGEVRYRWDGGPWERWREGPLAPPAGAGRHTLEVTAGGPGETASPLTVTVETSL